MVALLLAVVPMPDWATWYRPPWIALSLVYWGLRDDTRVGLKTAFVLGLLLDVLTGTVLGEHAAALCILVYVVAKLRLMIRVYPLVQQTLSVFLMLFLYQLVIIWLYNMLGDVRGAGLFWLPAVTGMLFWPLFVALLSRFGHRSRLDNLHYRY